MNLHGEFDNIEEAQPKKMQEYMNLEIHGKLSQRGRE